jgi:hypothetical protein
LEEFWDEAEDDPVKMSSISKKLLSAISYEDRKRLNHQDLQDLKEIQQMIEIADIRAKPAKSPLKEDSIFEGDLPFESKQLTDSKWYLDV